MNPIQTYTAWLIGNPANPNRRMIALTQMLNAARILARKPPAIQARLMPQFLNFYRQAVTLQWGFNRTEQALVSQLRSVLAILEIHRRKAPAQGIGQMDMFAAEPAAPGWTPRPAPDPTSPGAMPWQTPAPTQTPEQPQPIYPGPGGYFPGEEPYNPPPTAPGQGTQTPWIPYQPGAGTQAPGQPPTYTPPQAPGQPPVYAPPQQAGGSGLWLWLLLAGGIVYAATRKPAGTGYTP